MYESYTLLAVIPARGGSKGLPNKNMLKCAGKPLLEWTIAAAVNSSPLDAVLVSTDSLDIAAISKRAGALVPFLRPDELAQDESSTIDAVEHAWENQLQPNGRPYDYVVLLQPTSPLRTVSHINDAISHFFRNRQSDTDTLASVYQANSKCAWLMEQAEDPQYIRFCLDIKLSNPQRQKLSTYYFPNGAIYIIKGNRLRDGVYGNNTIPFVMNISDSTDIDTLDDLLEAEIALLLRQQI